MQKSSLVIGIIATGAVLATGFVATSAVVNAAQGTRDVQAAVADPGSGGTQDPGLVTLPAAPTLDAVAVAPRPVKERAVDLPATPASPASGRSGHAVTLTVSSRQALDTVRRASGGTPVGISQVRHQGYPAWAVQVRRPDGSILTGYVDRASGATFDWVVNRPPTQTPTIVATGNSHESDDPTEDGAFDSESQTEDD